MELPIKNTLSGPAFLSRLCQKGERWYRQQIINLSCCDLCGLQCRGFPLLCNSCFDDLPIFYVDKTAGDLLNWPAINKALPNINFDHLICLSPYVAPFDHWLNQFKYQGRFELGDLFAQLLAQYWKNNHLMFLGDPPDLVLAVPLHIDKWKIRGYNQAHLIARSLAKKNIATVQ